MRLLHNFLDEGRFRLANTWATLRAHPWDSARTVAVTAVLAGFLATRILDLAPRTRARLEAHPELFAFVAIAALVLVARTQSVALSRRLIANVRRGWRRGFPLTRGEVQQTITVCGAAAALPLALTFVLGDTGRSIARGDGAAAALRSAGVLVAVALTVAGSIALEERAWSNGERASENERRAPSRRRRAGALGWLAARLSFPRHRALVGLILHMSAPGSRAAASRWGRRASLASIGTAALIALRSDLAVFVLPAAFLGVASFPAPGRLLWIARHLALPFGSLLGAYLVAAALAASPLALASVIVLAFRPQALGAVALGLLLGAALIGWQILIGLAIHRSRIRRLLVTGTAAIAVGLSWATPGLAIASPVPFVLLARDARRVFRDEDAVPPS